MAHPDGFHILAELMSAESLTSPIKASGRIKYTCIAASNHYIGLGASSGSLYVFHRTTFRYLQAFTNTEGALTRVAFAPDDNIVGMATSQGVIIVWELNIEKRIKSERLAMSSAHRNGNVTAMIWDTASERLFSADNHGRITFLNAYHRKMSGLFKLPTELVMDADSAIVQLDYCDDKLLASTTTKCFICDTKKKQAYAVGTKLRDGQFGACFLQKATKEFPLVYSARPGSRIWEVNIVGQVQATHQFKHLLALPALPVVGPGHTPCFPGPEHSQKPQSLNFAQLLTFGHGHNLLLTWNSQAIYVFDPGHIKVLVWSTDFKDILWASVYKSRVYCLHPNSQVRCYTLLSAERCISKLFALSLWEQCAHAAVYFAERVKQGNARRYVPRSLIQEVNYQLMDGNADFSLIGQLEELLSNMEDDGLSTPNSSRRSSLDSFEGMRLDSGIYLVRKRAGSDDSVEDVPVLKAHTLVMDRETQIGEFEMKREENSDITSKQATAMSSEIDTQSDWLERSEAKQGETMDSAAACEEDVEDFEEDVAVSGFDIEEDEEIDDPGGLLKGPAGINWSFGHGRQNMRRESSLLEEIAEKTAAAEVDVLVKDGELDFSIAESLNLSTSGEEPASDTHTDTHTDTQRDDPGGNQVNKSDETEGKGAGGSHGNQGVSANQDGASHPEENKRKGFKDSACDSKLQASATSHTDNSSQSSSQSAVNSSETHPFSGRRHPENGDSLHSAADHLRIGPMHESTEKNYHRTLGDSQMGPMFSNETFSSKKSVTGGKNTSSSQSEKPRPDFLPVEPEGQMAASAKRRGSHEEIVSRIERDFKAASFSLDDSIEIQQDWPAMRRNVSMSSADQYYQTMEGRKERKPSYSSRDKKRSKKSRIIDLDHPEVSPGANQAESDSAFTAAVTPQDTPKKQTRTPQTSTPIKRSHSLTMPTVSSLPTSPSKTPNQSEFPPLREMDFPRSNSFSSEAVLGAGSFDNDELLWGGSMLFAMSGPKLASVMPTFSVMKESLSSKLERTKSFLKQMSEPEIGSLPADVSATATTQPEVLSPVTPQSPSPDPTMSPRPSPTDSPLTKNITLPTGKESLQSPKILISKTTFSTDTYHQMETGVSEFDEEKDKVEYCSGLADDDVIKELALATWHAKHKLRDPKLSLSINGCHSILKKWLHKLQIALASKSHPLHTESYEEVMQRDRIGESTKSLTRETISHVEEDMVEGSAGEKGDMAKRSEPSGGEVCPVQLTPDVNNVNVLTSTPAKTSCHLSDPFDLPTSILEDLSHLAMLCFEMNIFGKENITMHTSTVQSDRLSDNERSGSSQDGESSSPETDQLHPFLDPNMNSIHAATLSPSMIGQHQNVNSYKASINKKNSLCNKTSQHDIMDNQPCVSMETDSSLIERDTKAAKFVKCFFFLLDVERVREILKSREGCRRQTMAAILDCQEASERQGDAVADSVTKLVQVIKTDMQRGKHINPSHLHRLLLCGQAETALDIMLGSFPDLAPWEVMLLTQPDTVPSGMFMDYAMALLDSVEPMDRDAMLAAICSDQEVKCHLLTSALSQGTPPAAELFCTCGNMPRPGAHLKQWHHSGIADQILGLTNSQLDQLLGVCVKRGYWPGVLRLSLDLQQREYALRIALQLADMQVFTQEGVIPKNMDEWVLLLNLMSNAQPISRAIHCVACSTVLLTKQGSHWLIPLATSTSPSEEGCDWTHRERSSKPECDWLVGDASPDEGHQDVNKLQSDWLPTVTWLNISMLLVESVGPGLAARMLLDTGIPCDELPREFFKNCISVSIKEKHERSLCLNMLEGLDTYLWSKRNNMMSPILYHQLTQGQTAPMNRKETDSEASVLKESSVETKSKDFVQFIEDQDCHWGTNIRLNSKCEVCGVTLSSSVSLKTPGLLAFPCGHAFHAACVVEKACVLCYELNYHRSNGESHTK